MRTIRLLTLGFAIAAFSTVVHAEDAEDSGLLWGWNVSVGGNIGFGLKTHLTTSPVAAVNAAPRAVTTQDKKVWDGQRYQRVEYASGGYVDPDSEASMSDPRETIDWGLPAGSPGNVKYALSGENPYVRVTEGATRNITGSDDGVAYGASVDLSHLLYMSEDGSWGVDIQVGLSWMKAKDCYEKGGVAYSQDVEEGAFVTTFQSNEGVIESGLFDPDFNDYTWGGQAKTQEEAWGNGKVPTPLNMQTAQYSYRPDSSRGRTESLYLYSHGDYEEWEISVLLKPWYDINDWLCIHGAIGAGVTRSSFEYSMEAVYNGSTVYRSSEEFNEWRCYGIAGAGVLLRAWDFDVSCDGLFRWCQKDMEINGKDVHGTLEKPSAVLRLGLSYAF